MTRKTKFLKLITLGNQFAATYPMELVGLGSSSSMDFVASWRMNGSGMEKGREREETPLQGEDESRRSSPP